MVDESGTPEAFFDGSPEGLAVYDAVAGAVRALGTVETRVSRSQIAFRGRRGFAYLWRPSRYVRSNVPAVLSIATPYELSSDRFKSVVHPSATTWMHHLEVAKVTEIDEEVVDWLTQAYRSATGGGHDPPRGAASA